MAKTSRPYLITRHDQLGAIASAARQEILDVLSRMGAASVFEIADTLGRPPDALYYHLRRLLAVGLVLPAGSRRRSGRDEALFRTVATELAIGHRLAESGHRRRMKAIVGSMVRLGARDYDRALASPGVALAGAKRDLWAVRTTGWLTPTQVASANRDIRRLMRTISQPRRRGRLYAVTVVLVPLDRRARQAAGVRSRRRS